MKELIDLVKVVTRNKVKSIRTIDSEDNDRITDFYNRLTQNQFGNDVEASQFYFNSDEKSSKYRKLKNKLKQRLWDSIIFVDTSSPRFNDSQKAFYTCQKYLIIIRILLGRNARTSALDLMKRTLKFSKRFEFSEISLEIYRLLRSHHAMKTGDRKKYEFFDQKVNEYDEIVNAENIVRYHYDRLALESRNKSNVTEEYHKVAAEAFREFSKIKVTSLRFILFSGVVKTEYLINAKRYSEAVNESDNILIALQEKSAIGNQFLAQFHYIKLIAYTQLQKYELGKKVYEDCCLMFEPGSVRWFNAHDIYYILLMRTKSYGELFPIYQKVTTNPSFKSVPAARKETWRIYEAYLHFLLLIKKLIVPENSRIHNFRVNKFLNEVPKYSLDKAGYNIPVLIIQILILITQKRYDQLNDKIEAIEKYSSRYLRKDNNFRSNCFIKMLLQIPKRQYHRKAVERHAMPYLKKLHSVPLDKANQSFEIEIIPYEHLWAYVLESLDNRFH